MVGAHAYKQSDSAGTILTGSGILYRLRVRTANASGVIFTVYDNTAASGDVIEKASTPTQHGMVDLDFGPSGISFAAGIHVGVDGGSLASVTAVYGGSKAS